MALDAEPKPAPAVPRQTSRAEPRQAQGSSPIRLGQLVLDDVGTKLGPVVLHADKVTLRQASLDLQAGEGGAVPLPCSIAAEEALLEGVAVQLDGTPDITRLPAGPWQLDALDGLTGTLSAFITDAAWHIDADVTVPIRSGAIDFNDVTVEHVGPDSSMGISHLGIYVDAPNGRDYLFRLATGHVPGARFERRGSFFGAQVGDRGSLSLQAFLECLLRNAATRPIGQLSHQAGEQMDRTRLRGDVQLGDGALGVGAQRLTLAGRAEGHNKVTLSATVLSDSLLLRLPSLCARDALLSLGGWRAEVGTICGDATLRLSGLGMPGRRRDKPPKAVLELSRLSLQGLRLTNA